MNTINIRKISKKRRDQKKKYNNYSKKKKGGSLIDDLIGKDDLSIPEKNINPKREKSNLICSFDKWYTNNFHFKNYKIYQISDYFYINHFFDNYSLSKDYLKRYIMNNLDTNLSEKDIVWLDDLSTSIIKIENIQSYIPHFVDYNLNLKNNNKIFREAYNKWKNDKITPESIYNQLYNQLKDKYIIKLKYNRCSSDNIIQSEIKVYFNDSFILNNSFDNKEISKKIFNSNIYFQYFEDDIPPDPISFENLLNENKNILDVLYPQVKVMKEYNKIEEKKSGFYDIFKSIKDFIDKSEKENNKNILYEFSKLAENRIKDLLEKDYSYLEKKKRVEEKKKTFHLQNDMFKDILKSNEDKLLVDTNKDLMKNDFDNHESRSSSSSKYIKSFFSSLLNSKSVTQIKELFSNDLDLNLSNNIEILFNKEKERIDDMYNAYDKILIEQYSIGLLSLKKKYVYSEKLMKLQNDNYYRLSENKLSQPSSLKTFLDSSETMENYLNNQTSIDKRMDKRLSTRNIIQSIFIFNTKNINSLKEKINMLLSELDDTQSNDIKINRNNFNNNFLSESNFKINQILLSDKSRLSMSGNLLIVLPFIDSNLSYNRSELDGIQLCERDTNKDYQEWIELYKGIYTQDIKSNQIPDYKDNELNKSNYIIGNCPLIYISIPIKSIFNINNNKYIPFIKHINLNEEYGISLTNEIFSKLELVSLLNLLLKNNLTIKNNFFTNLNFNPIIGVKILQKVNQYLNRRIHRLNNFIINFESKMDDGQKKIINEYIGECRNNYHKNLKKINDYNSWKDFISN